MPSPEGREEGLRVPIERHGPVEPEDDVDPFRTRLQEALVFHQVSDELELHFMVGGADTEIVNPGADALRFLP